MILRQTQGTHICLRCKLRLLNGPIRARGSLTTLIQRTGEKRLQHNKARPQHTEDPESFSTVLERSREGENGEAWDKQRKPKRHYSFKGSRRILQNYKLTARPLGRLYGFRGHTLREEAVGIDVETLGEKAEVIVLRDTRVEFQPRPKMEDLEIKGMDILAQLDAERGLISQAEVEKNIEELMPTSFQGQVSWDELQSIERQLVNGFTVSQLVRYVGSFEQRQKEKGNSDSQQIEDGPLTSIIRQTHWMPGTSETGEEFEESLLRGYGSEAFTPKQRLALQLLRQCWKVEVREIVESIGEVELEIRKAELELLITGRNPPLKVVTEELIATQDEKIEAFRSRGVIRVTAPKEKSEIIVREITDVLRNVQRLPVDLKYLLSPSSQENARVANVAYDAFDDSFIDELSRLTDTQIERDSKNQLTISCIKQKPESILSTRAEVARRLLLTSVRALDRTLREIVRIDVSESIVPIKYHAKDGMSWHDQLRQWVRWTTPVSKFSVVGEENDAANRLLAVRKGDTPNQQSVTVPQSTMQSSKKGSNGPDLIIEPKDTSVHASWGPPSYPVTSAIFGHVLHEVQNVAEVSTMPLMHPKAQNFLFHPVTAQLSNLLGRMNAPKAQPEQSVMMRFRPSPWTAAGYKSLINFPPVEMHFKVESITKDLELEEIIAQIASNVSDVMLPDRALDIRFQKRVGARLHHQYHQLPEIADFLKASQLNLMRGRLETPPSLTLPIATHLCSLTESGSSSSTLTDCVDVEYLFAGLEYRKTLLLDFEDWILGYTSVEGGKADGRKGELSLRLQRLSSAPSELDGVSAEWQEQHTQDFINAAYRLVDSLENFDAAVLPVAETLITGRKILTIKGDEHKAFKYFSQTADFENESKGRVGAND